MQTPRTAAPLEIQTWPIDRLALYARNPPKNDSVVDRMCSSIREFGFKIPVLARSDGEVVDGHLRIKAARTLGISELPVILCDEWTPAQVKAFRLLVNRSVTWVSWDDELLALELQELNEADFDLSLTGFDPGEIDALLVAPEDDEKANAAPPLPEKPVSRPGDLWLCDKHRVLCGDATSPDAVHVYGAAWPNRPLTGGVGEISSGKTPELVEQTKRLEATSEAPPEAPGGWAS